MVQRTDNSQRSHGGDESVLGMAVVPLAHEKYGVRIGLVNNSQEVDSPSSVDVDCVVSEHHLLKTLRYLRIAECQDR